ncbi:MAG: hypothetical protein NTU83_04105 [Candidatus Hydrogenedentes bacterium]|nr:hypothetical protein [Candidatus Hydrogenedentota bacterium]
MKPSSIRLLALCAVLAVALYAGAQEVAPPYPRISEEGFKARLPFFGYDATIPLEARVVQDWDKDDTLRQKIVFRGAQGFLVPGFLEFPKKAQKPYPLLLLLHGWSGNKMAWYEDENIIIDLCKSNATVRAKRKVTPRDGCNRAKCVEKH